MNTSEQEQLNKKIEYLRSTKRKEQLRVANLKWRKSPKGELYRQKQQQLEKLARQMIRQQKLDEQQQQTTEEQTTEEEQVSPKDKQFLEWCEQEHKQQVENWRDETTKKKKQHTKEYFECLPWNSVQ